jgi:sugar-phosphatase
VTRPKNAAIFDLDGLLVDSEPLWRRVEIELFAQVGLHLTEADCIETMGLRIDEVAAHWFAQRPWAGPSPAMMAERIVDAMVARAPREAARKPGVHHAIETCEAAGLRCAVASSSPERLIRAVLGGLGLEGRFEAVLSAEREPFGKPHPAVFLATASRLGVAPPACVVFEDSVNGMIAAKAARMKCIVVPEHGGPRFALADLVLRSLEELTPAHLDRALGIGRASH